MSKINNRALSMIRRATVVSSLVLGLSAISGAALAQQGGAYPEQTGEAIYKGICQGCHMPDAKGAQGAGIYPALAGNKKLAAKAYPALVIVRGQKAMPSFSVFSDTQIANVVNYIRSNFGNSFTDTMTPDEVKPLRPAGVAGDVRPPG
jgi:mono/diheme cytochrome c family protein